MMTHIAQPRSLPVIATSDSSCSSYSEVASKHGHAWTWLKARTFFLFSVIWGVSVCTAACTLASLCQSVVRSSGKEPSSVPVRPACRDSRISTSVAASLRASSNSCRRTLLEPSAHCSPRYVRVESRLSSSPTKLAGLRRFHTGLQACCHEQQECAAHVGVSDLPPAHVFRDITSGRACGQGGQSADLAVAGVEDAAGAPEEAQEHQLGLLQARVAGDGLQHVCSHLVGQGRDSDRQSSQMFERFVTIMSSSGPAGELSR